MRAINVFLAIVVSVLIGLAVLEGGLRLIGKGPKPSILEFDEHIGWRKKASTKISKSGPEFDVTIETNRYHLRDDDVESAAKPAGVFRVVMLGDSFTQGFTVDREDLFVDQLENWWKQEGRKVDVINAGCEGYSTDQQVAWLLQNVEIWRPDLVVIFPYENDLYWNGQPNYIDRDTPKAFFRADGALESGKLIDPGPRPLSERLAIGAPIKLLQGTPAHVAQHVFTPAGSARPILKEWGPLFVEQPDFMANALARTEGALRALRDTSAAHGAKALVVPIPSHSAIDAAHRETFGAMVLAGVPASAWSPDKPVDAVLAIAAKLQIPTLDPRPYLKARTKGGPQDLLEVLPDGQTRLTKVDLGPGEKLYFEKDWHLNASGNAAFATFLHDEIDKLDVFPPTHRAIAVHAAPPPHPEPETGGIPFELKLFAVLWVALSTLYISTYKNENKALAPLKVGAMLALVFGIFIGGKALIGLVPPQYSGYIVFAFIAIVLGFVLYKLGHRIATITELFKSFTLRGHWYLMPLIVVLLSIGSLLVVAASSPFVAPFIYTLF